MPFLIILIGGNRSESIIAPNSNCVVLIRDSVATALVSPVDGNPLITIPPSMFIGTISLTSISVLML